MTKEIWMRAAMKGVVLVVVIGLGFSIYKKAKSPVISQAPKIVSETRYFKDVSPYFYERVPFLLKGLQFIDSSTSQGNEEGANVSLLIQRKSKEGVSENIASLPPVHTTKDFAPFISAIKTEKEALAYVLFLSRKGYPWMEPVRLDYFQDVPFLAIEFVNISSATKAQNSIRPPRMSMVNGKPGKKKHYSIVRTVIPLDQPNLAEEKILSAESFLQLTELGEVTETVTEQGAYSYTLRRFPAVNCVIENPLKALRKTK